MITFTGRSNIKITDLKIYINEMLANEKVCEAEKVGLCVLLERVLLNTNNYRGFRNIAAAKHNYDRYYYWEELKYV